MRKEQKVKLLKEVLQGKDIHQVLREEEIGPLLIQMSNDEYYSPALVRTLTGFELRQKLTPEEIAEKVQIQFIDSTNPDDYAKQRK